MNEFTFVLMVIAFATAILAFIMSGHRLLALLVVVLLIIEGFRLVGVPELLDPAAEPLTFLTSNHFDMAVAILTIAASLCLGIRGIVKVAAADRSFQTRND
jgi:hypothetical protein